MTRRVPRPHTILHDRLDSTRTSRLALERRLERDRDWCIYARTPWQVAADQRVSTARHTLSFVALIRHIPTVARGEQGRQQPTPSRQRFEWRRTRGKDLAMLGIRKGWKLVWLRGADGGGGGMARRTRAGEEVVAIAGKTRRFRMMGNPTALQPEPQRLFSLKFVGLGREPGLGEAWEVMVVLTWLGVWAKWCPT